MPDATTPPGELKRELGLWGAVLLGLGSILGTGAFVTVPMIGFAAGPAALPAVLIAGLLAGCNGLSSARLAGRHPVSGGTYEYGHLTLNAMTGFAAGAMFLAAKSASCATAALGLAELARGLSPGFWGAGPWLPAAAVVGVTWLVAGGLRRSTLFNTVCVVTAVVVLIFYARVGLSGERPDGGAVRFDRVAETAALFFVAFTGYGRIATLGEEVSDPRRTIPRAVVITLSLCLILYVAVAEASRSMLGVMTSFELDGNPVVTALQFSPFEASSGRVIARIAALSAAASLLGVILNLVLGLSRVVLAMARRGDLPGYFAQVDAKTGSPKRAVWAVGGLVASLTLIGSIKTAWTFSAFTVLVYYAITNLACLRLDGVPAWNRVTATLGLVACLSLAAFIPWPVMAAGGATLAAGFALRAVVRRFTVA